MTAKRVVVVIPAYNEERTIVEVIRGLKQRGFTTLIVVDDGSSDCTGELASHEGRCVSSASQRNLDLALESCYPASHHYNDGAIARVTICC